MSLLSGHPLEAQLCLPHLLSVDCAPGPRALWACGEGPQLPTLPMPPSHWALAAGSQAPCVVCPGPPCTWPFPTRRWSWLSAWAPTSRHWLRCPCACHMPGSQPFVLRGRNVRPLCTSLFLPSVLHDFTLILLGPFKAGRELLVANSIYYFMY